MHMALNRIQSFYADHPLLVSSPFGGVDGINEQLFLDTLDALEIDLNGKSVLDIGCGRGFVRELVAKRGGKYTGVDLVPNGRGFPLVQADAHKLPFETASFDIVFCIDAFEHMPDPVAAANEFWRVIGADGEVFLSAPNYSNVAGLVKKYCETWGGYAKNTWAPFRQWQPQEWETPLTGRRVRAIFRAAAFRACRRIGHPAEVGLGLFPWIDHAKMPERLKYWLQRGFAIIGPVVARIWPGASLHGFWKFDA